MIFLINFVYLLLGKTYSFFKGINFTLNLLILFLRYNIKAHITYRLFLNR